jgi:SAM-dependent methyltransferase
MTRLRTSAADWGRYLAQFHAARPGITEEILVEATSEVGNPYQWLIEAVPHDGSVLDVACGSAPLRRYDRRKVWIGIDRSSAELERARSKGALPVILGDVSRLPTPDGSFGVVVCAMAMMLFDPLDDCLSEMIRVLAPDGTMAVLLPGGSPPLRPSDLARWARLLTALRVARLGYPNDRSIRRFGAAVHGHGLRVVADERRRFSFHFTNAEAADRFVDSLYLPETNPRRTATARLVARTWVGGEIGIPLRRVCLRSI